jgi:geranylgeranyl pyrophosphate synthase
MDLNQPSLSRLKRRLKDCFLEDETLRNFANEDYFWAGRGFRGQLSLDVGFCFDLSEEYLLDIALFTELLHNASLVHDDIVDGDHERRGHQTVWHKYGLSKALLVGDLLIAKAFEVASSSSIDSIVKTKWTSSLSKAVSVAVRGAICELEFKVSDTDDIFPRYLSMANDKTGVMFTLPIFCVGYAARLEDAQITKLTDIFAKLAVAYQIRDDEADYLGNKTGRVTMSDILNKRPNLYYLLSKSDSYAADLFNHASNFHEKLIGEAEVGLEAFPNSLSKMIREFVLPFVQLTNISDSTCNLVHQK